MRRPRVKLFDYRASVARLHQVRVSFTTFHMDTVIASLQPLQDILYHRLRRGRPCLAMQQRGNISREQLAHSLETDHLSRKAHCLYA